MKRVLALACVVILIISVVVMLVAAITGSPAQNEIFIAAMSVNIILPVMLWVYIQTAKFLKRKGEEIRNEDK
ncbi:MAG: hypothetical protein IJP13_02975 [Lachnospiraceae bacterium]|nr:hypothetical protein [Lachnospiraceae bacterium]